jgi:hypothetical protein
LPKNTITQYLQLIKAILVILLIFVLAIQYVFVTPPNNDYFNVNLGLVTGVVILFSALMTWLSIYNYRKIKTKIEESNQIRNDEIKESYIQTWAPISGGCLICQLVYFHIYGSPLLIVASILTLLILIVLKIKNGTAN